MLLNSQKFHYTGRSLCVVCLLSCVIVPIFAAEHVITFLFENRVYFYSAILAIIGILMQRDRQGGGKWRIAHLGYSLLSLFVAIALSFWTWDNDVFFHLTKALTSNSDWNRINGSLITLSKVDEDGSSASVNRAEIDQNLYRLGRIDDFDSGYVNSKGVLLMYGPKSRRWGVAKGDPGLIPSNLKLLRTARVASNLWFYIGVD